MRPLLRPSHPRAKRFSPSSASHRRRVTRHACACHFPPGVAVGWAARARALAPCVLERRATRPIALHAGQSAPPPPRVPSPRQLTAPASASCHICSCRPLPVIAFGCASRTRALAPCVLERRAMRPIALHAGHAARLARPPPSSASRRRWAPCHTSSSEQSPRARPCAASPRPFPTAAHDSRIGTLPRLRLPFPAGRRR